jgi:hypothetical protein
MCLFTGIVSYPAGYLDLQKIAWSSNKAMEVIVQG